MNYVSNLNNNNSYKPPSRHYLGVALCCWLTVVLAVTNIEASQKPHIDNNNNNNNIINNEKVLSNGHNNFKLSDDDIEKRHRDASDNFNKETHQMKIDNTKKVMAIAIIPICILLGLCCICVYIGVGICGYYIYKESKYVPPSLSQEMAASEYNNNNNNNNNYPNNNNNNITVGYP
eukprot:Tbor_TRINITY_DN5369_c3_g2::TRINITY_DN5369_c3_g2_i16::g.3958::m.3958